MNSPKQLDFTSILASSIHDMKNSLGMVLSALEEIVDPVEGRCRCTPEQVAQLQYEARRVNDNLVQLLTLYRLGSDLYSPNIDEVEVADFLDECYLLNKPLLDFKGIEAEVVCDPDLLGYFDRDLVAGVVNNIITNAVRYTETRIRVLAESREGFLVITVEDDGPGFPQPMLDTPSESLQEIDMISGRTKLGLVFCRKVAELHTSDHREGRIHLENGGPLGGGRFSLYLP